MVTERNWLEVYPYTKWGGNDSLPHLQEGQTFMPSHLMLKEVGAIVPSLYAAMMPSASKAGTYHTMYDLHNADNPRYVCCRVRMAH